MAEYFIGLRAASLRNIINDNVDKGNTGNGENYNIHCPY
jgi:hypothetical protein